MAGPNHVLLATKLIAITLDALRGQKPREKVRSILSEAFAGEPLASCIAALTGAIDGYRGSASLLMATSESVLVQSTMAERALMLDGVADIAHEVGDLATEIACRQEAILAQRLAGESHELLTMLSTILYKQSKLYGELGDHAAAVSLLEEVVELDKQVRHPAQQAHQAALRAEQQRINKVLVSKLHDGIIEWRDGSRDVKNIIPLINMVMSVSSDTLRKGTSEERNALAEDLALLRAAGPLPVKGLELFLQVLQLLLRDEPGMAEKAAQLQKALPKEFSQKLLRVIGQ